MQKKERDLLEKDRKKAEDALAKHINPEYEMTKQHLMDDVAKAKRNEERYDQKIAGQNILSPSQGTRGLLNK